MTCPACSHTRKKKSDKCMSWNHNKEVGHCNHCDEVFFIPKEIETRFETPKQDWMNHTAISDKLVHWFGSRGLSQKTIIDNKITEEKHFQPQEGKEVNNIVFNYFVGSKLVNKKYRSARKAFTQSKNARKTLYGLNDIVGENEIYIVEGEMDKLSLWEVGFKNCVSVPNGANDITDIFDGYPEINEVERVNIAVDMDAAGYKLEQELIKRFGKWRCRRVKFKGKDANDDLITDRIDLEKILSDPEPYPVDGTFTAEDVRDEIMDFYDNGYDETIKPKSDRWRHFNRDFSILMGQLTVVTGIPSHGKSAFVEDYVLSLVHDYDFKASFYSPEHFPVKYHHGALSEKVIGKPLSGSNRMSKGELSEYIKWSSRRLYFTSPEKGDSATWDWLLDKFKEQMFRFGIDLFVIDAFNKVKRNQVDSRGELEEILMRLTQFVQDYNVHLFLVAHPTKIRKIKDTDEYPIPTLYDVKGTGDFRDQAHNGIVVHRYFESETTSEKVLVGNLKTKFKHQGNIGKFVEFSYDKTCGRYYPLLEMPDRNSLITKEKDVDLFKPIEGDAPF